jgi:selenophosphate synthetase-related protein
MDDPQLAEVVDAFRANPALRAKASLALVREIFGTTDWLHGPGDDAAVIEDRHGYVLAAGEAIYPPFVEADPFNAGVAAVVTNVNDIAAMGGEPLGLIDHVVSNEDIARQVLEGIRFAADLYEVPVIGGHLTIRDGPPGVTATAVGRATTLLSARNVAPGQVVLLACSVEGRMREDFPFFSSVEKRSDRVASDVRILPQVAEESACTAAKDVSMPGLLGSLAMLLEPTRSGATVELERIPRPEGVPLATWAIAFPSFAFLLCSPPDQVDACRDAFVTRGIMCEPVGAIDGTGVLRARHAGAEAELIDLNKQSVTNLGDERPV